MDMYPHHQQQQLDALAAAQKEREVNAELEKHQQAAKVREEKVEWDYQTREQLERSSPSMKDGLEPEKEALWRRQFMTIIQKTGMHLRM